jgi:hypothetical protein
VDPEELPEGNPGGIQLSKKFGPDALVESAVKQHSSQQLCQIKPPVLDKPPEAHEILDTGTIKIDSR